MNKTTYPLFPALLLAVVLISGGCGDGANLSPPPPPPPPPPPISSHFCDLESMPSPKPTDPVKADEWEDRRVAEETAFYKEHHGKTFDCPKSGIMMIWLNYKQSSGSTGLWMSANEISRADYHKVMDQKGKEGEDSTVAMTNLSVKDMLAFCEKMTDCWRKMRPPNRIPAIYKFDLPTDDEWNSAAEYTGSNALKKLTAEKANFNERNEGGRDLGQLAPSELNERYVPNSKGFRHLWGNAKEVVNDYSRGSSKPSWEQFGGSFKSEKRQLPLSFPIKAPSGDLGFRIVLAWDGGKIKPRKPPFDTKDE